MGTRGSYGFRVNQTDKLFYNHSDSYPDGLGENVVQYAKSIAGDLPAIRDAAASLVLVDRNSPVDPDILARALDLNLVDLSVSRQSLSDWYCVLRGAQGDLAKVLKVGAMLDDSGFVADSLFCEYAYIINLDTEELEFYEGLNKNPDAEGRYAHLTLTDEFYGVALKGTCPLADIPEDWAARFYPEDETEAA